jgi:hypothetical protein
MLNACATILEPLDPFEDNPFQHDAVPVLHWHPTHFSTWYTFSPWKKQITAVCSSLVQVKSGASYLWHKTHDRNGLSRSRLHHNGRKEVDHVYHVMPNQLCSQLQNMYLDCR